MQLIPTRCIIHPMLNEFCNFIVTPVLLTASSVFYMCGQGLPRFCHSIRACDGNADSIDYIEKTGKIWDDFKGNCTELTFISQRDPLISTTRAWGCRIAETNPALFYVASAVCFLIVTSYCLFALSRKQSGTSSVTRPVYTMV